MYSGKNFRTLSKYHRTLSERFSARLSKLHSAGSPALKFGKSVFQHLLDIFLALFEQKCFSQSCQNFFQRGRRNIFGKTFPTRAKVFWIMSKNFSEDLPILLFTCPGEFFCRNKLSEFDGEMFGSF